MKKRIFNYFKGGCKKKVLLRIYLLIGFVTVLIVGSMGYTYYQGNHMATVHGPLVDATMEIRLNVTTGHLHLEEMFNGNIPENIIGGLKPLEEAKWYAQAMLEGGVNSEGKFVSLDDRLMRQEVAEICEKLCEFRKITLKRWETRETAGISSLIKQEYNEIFHAILEQADIVETQLQKLIGVNLKNFRRVQIALVSLCLSVTVAVGIAFGRFVNTQIQDEQKLRAANQQFDASNQQLRASEQHLKAANQQLDASNQQLTASEEQSKVANQQLLVSQQQLKAANQQLSAGNQQLHANEEMLSQTNRQLEAMVEQADLLTKEAVSANEAKSLFLANMSHEIRTPMNAIIGFTDLMAIEELTQKQKQYIDIINNSGHDLLKLINDILDFSKIEANELDSEISLVETEQLLNSIELLLKPKAEKKGLGFKITKEAKVPIRMRTDSHRVRQCLINLIDNAIKFTQQGHVHVSVSADQNKNGSFVRFDIKDTGIGIATDKQDAVFELFTQADNSTRRNYGGTGLGLAITRQLAELLDGKVTMTSELGKGSVFSFIIPAGVDLDEQTFSNSNGIESKAHSYTNTGERLEFSGHVLVAEDCETNQILARSLLECIGLEVTIAEDGNQALQQVLSKDFDLIFMDIQMPNMNGYEATKAIREQNVKTPIIALTAFAMKDDEKKCLEAGCDDYLSKPINQKDLLNIINKYLPCDAIAATPA